MELEPSRQRRESQIVGELGETEMRTSEALAVLASMRPEVDNIEIELGQRGNTAYLQVSSRKDPTRWAAVWTPGDAWFSLDVDGDFSYNYFEERHS